MKISKPDESSLLIALTEGLQGANVTYYGYVSMPKDWEKNTRAALDSDFIKQLYSRLDDGGLEGLIQRIVLAKFYDNGHDLPADDHIRSLVSYGGITDALALSRDIVNEITQSPYQYEVCVRALNSFAEGLKDKNIDVVISDRMRLVSGHIVGSLYITSVPNPKIDGLLSAWNSRDSSMRTIDDAALYFVYRTSGFLTDKTDPRPLSNFFDDIRAFYGASIAFKIFSNFQTGDNKGPVLFLTNKLDGNERSFAHSQVANSDIVSATFLYPIGGADALPKSPVELCSKLENVIKLFKSPETQRLRTAAIWLLRASLTSRGMDKILDSTIAIEVLLGDRDTSDRIGLSKLMANRCAYSLGKTTQERRDLSEFFTKFYKVRSDIVHSGRLKLSESEAEVVNEGRALASRILLHETIISTR